MEYTTLGRTGRKVSRLGFGGATAGLKNYLKSFDPSSEEDRAPIVGAIRRALELGVNYFDTAAGYGEGASERIFGEALEGVAPDSIFLATKFGIWKETDVRRSLEESLRNLRRDQVDLLQIHGTAYTDEQAERVLRKGGYLDQLERLRDEGLIRWIGFTVEAVNEPCCRFIKSGRFDVIQILYNLIFQHPFDPGWKSGALYDAEAQKMGIATMRTPTSNIFQRWVQMVNPANTFDYTPALIQFVLSNPLVDVALIGMRSAKRVEDNVRIAEDLAGRIDIPKLFARYV
jgi:predicted aldo/keto reductase-like oxidoreductase